MSAKTPLLFEDKSGIKSPLTITGQLNKLMERGMIIGDVDKARRNLETVNYYRLVHYFAVFLEESGQTYKEGTNFDDAIRLYDFDRKLRAVMLGALEEIEIAVRAAVSNYHSVKYKALGYRNAESFDRRHNHKAFMKKIEIIITKNANLSFVRHHQQKYGGSFPLWVLMEMFSFGMLAVFYQDMIIYDKKEIAKHYFNIDFRIAEDWFEHLATLRNRCAHYNRIYGNPLPAIPRAIEIIKPREYQMGGTLFDYVLMIKFLHKRDENLLFVHGIDELFRDYADIVEPEVLGFPNDWKDFV